MLNLKGKEKRCSILQQDIPISGWKQECTNYCIIQDKCYNRYREFKFFINSVKILHLVDMVDLF